MQVMLPMELRTCREPDAQLQYKPFRNTVFTDRGDKLAASRGPGALFRDEWNSLAGNAQRYKPLSLYCTERNVNPTPTATVQRFYDPQKASDLGSQLKTKGNTVASLKSNVPRFHPHETPTRGPGSYFPDRYNGAFPALFDKMTPRTVRIEKLQAKRALAATFGIVPGSTANIARSPSPVRASAKHRADNSAAKACGHTLAEFPEIPLETTRLAPALTSRNTYHNAANRQIVLSTRPRDSVSPS